MGESYDKVKLIILRAALIVIGAGTGYLALWQYFLVYPNVVGREYQIVITVVSAALVALIFGLSAKPVYKLASSLAGAVGGLKTNVGARGIIAVVLGLAAAGAVTVAFDVVIRRAVDIWAGRLLADVLVYIAAAFCGCVGFTKWINVPRTEKPKGELPPVGYLLAAECFTDERVLTAVHSLINVKVLDGAFKALCLYGGEEGIKGAKLMDELINSGALCVLNTNKQFADKDAYLNAEKNIAAAKRLKYISRGDGEFSLAAVFAPPSDGIKNSLALNIRQEQSESGLFPPDKSNDQAVNGQIIIDK